MRDLAAEDAKLEKKYAKDVERIKLEMSTILTHLKEDPAYYNKRGWTTLSFYNKKGKSPPPTPQIIADKLRLKLLTRINGMAWKYQRKGLMQSPENDELKREFKEYQEDWMKNIRNQLNLQTNLG